MKIEIESEDPHDIEPSIIALLASHASIFQGISAILFGAVEAKVGVRADWWIDE